MDRGGTEQQRSCRLRKRDDEETDGNEMRGAAGAELRGEEGPGCGEEVPDYMADLSTFLVETGGRDEQGKGRSKRKKQRTLEETAGIEHVFTGLTWQEKRRLKQEQRRESERKKREEEDEVLMKGLAKPIAATNVGFKLLQKMGFKPHNQEGPEVARKVPVPIELKRDRLGLGRGEVEEEERGKRRRKDGEEEEARARQAVERVRQFEESKRSKWEKTKMRRDFKKASVAVIHFLGCKAEETRGYSSRALETSDFELPLIVRDILQAAQLSSYEEDASWNLPTGDGDEHEGVQRHLGRNKHQGSFQEVAEDDAGEGVAFWSLGSDRQGVPRPRNKECAPGRMRSGEREGGAEAEAEKGWAALLDRVTPEVLLELVAWLRETHHFCVHCGYQA